MTFEEDFLAHYGKKGMQWGKSSVSGVSKSTDKMAKKDAKEFSRAKMYYGEGAGTRRKLIKGSTEAKIKRDPAYKKAFEEHMSRQDMSVHATKAIRQRSRTDKKNTSVKTGKAVARRVTGEMGSAAAIVALVGTGYAFSKTPQGKKIMSSSINMIKKQATSAKRAKNIRDLNRLFNL